MVDTNAIDRWGCLEAIVYYVEKTFQSRSGFSIVHPVSVKLRIVQRRSCFFNEMFLGWLDSPQTKQRIGKFDFQEDDGFVAIILFVVVLHVQNVRRHSTS